MKWVTLVLLAALLWLQQDLWLSKGGWRDMWRLEAEVEAQGLANDALVVRNQALAAEVEDLRNGQDAIAEIARTDLGYVQSGETFYRILPAEAAAE
ncbi:MAG: cell division protein FtsB [Eikenella sp.]|uniref:Cell division protein FtsB n=1 Tax=Neisseria shayeganii 871 TaxID=1032488 RepID=G4CJW4_9NEIS|nr:cell division protein FtsB [Neisseria shayeganii]EGY51855.1 cell division protein FtsB [Neisseria shayeganii 871]MDO4694704.1 cell division protein FtsB [Eikenella sp.]